MLGLGYAGAYALVALGIVIVFRASGVINFASGAMGAVGGYMFWELRNNHGTHYLAALLGGILVGAAVGAATHVLVMSRLRASSALVKVIASLAVMGFIQGVANLEWGSAVQRIDPPVLSQNILELTNTLVVGRDRLMLLGIAVGLAMTLRAFYSFTRFGLAATAVSENRRAAATLGWSTNAIELASWTLGGGLSALAAILLAPILGGLNVVTLTLLVLPALAAALIGGFSSFGLTVVGAVILGVLNSEGTYYIHTTGIPESVPLLVIVVVIVLRGKTRPSRSDLPLRLPLPGRGRVSVPAVVAGAGLAAALIWSLGPAWVDAITTTLVFAILILSIVVVTGLAGQLSLGQWALAGFGAWVAGRLMSPGGLVIWGPHFDQGTKLVSGGHPFWLAALAGIALAVPAGVLIALPALRTRGVNLAVVTLALATMISSTIFGNELLTGGVYGTRIGRPHIFGFDVDGISHPQRYATMALILFIGLALVVANVRRGQTGRRLLAVRSNERAAAAIGIGVYGAKLYAFGLGAAIAAVAGILAVFRQSIISFETFNVFTSINAVVYAVLGGIGWVVGSVFGAFFAPGSIFAKLTSEILGTGEVFSHPINDWLPIVGAISAILILMTHPHGIAAVVAQRVQPLEAKIRTQFRRTAERVAGRRGRAAVAPPPITREAQVRRAPMTLEVENLTVRFGGVVALDDVSLRVEPGEIVGLIGPNGAGKTTLLDAVTGFTRPAGGTVLLDGKPIGGWSPVQRARAGLGRSFQGVELFEEMTVRENLLAAADPHKVRSYFLDLVHPGRPWSTDLMDEVVEDFELGPCLDVLPPELSYGTRRLVGIARALVAEPSVLFLDEPAAGLDSHERAELGALARRVTAERNLAVVLVEHDVPLVLSTCDRIVVLDFGRQIAAGPPDAIARDPNVIRAYLGEEREPVAPPAGGRR